MGMFRDAQTNLDQDSINQKVHAGGDYREMRLCAVLLDFNGVAAPAIVTGSGYGFTTPAEISAGLFQIEFTDEFLYQPILQFSIRIRSGSTILGYHCEQIPEATDTMKQRVRFNIVNSSNAKVDDPTCVVHIVAVGVHV